jgi:hypothetical protein
MSSSISQKKIFGLVPNLLFSSLYTSVLKPVIPAWIAGAVDHEVNPGYMDVFKLAIHGTGYPLPGGYDELPA